MPDSSPTLFGVAMLAAGLVTWWLARHKAATAGLYFGLLILGQAASLQLTEAGPRVAYQHLLPLGRMWAEHPLAVAFVIAQFAAVAAGLWRLRGVLIPLVKQIPRRWALAGCFTMFVLGSATLSRAPGVYVTELIAASAMETVALGTLTLALLALPAEVTGRFATGIDRLLGNPRDEGLAEQPGVDGFALGLAAWVVAVALVLNRLSYQSHPHLPDEVAYLFHAKYFARGLLTVPPPPVPAAFDIDLLTYEPGRWYSPVPPGWPAMLALGQHFGVPSFVNPVLAGLNVLLAYLLLLELYDRRTARTTLVLLATSPWHLFMAMNYMNHTFAFTAALVAALGVARSRRGSQYLWPLAAGAATGIVSLIRPLEGVVVAGLLGLWALAPRSGRWNLRPAAAFSIGTLAVGGLVFPYNAALTGNFRVFPIMQYTDSHYGPGTNALGFGPNRGLGWGGLDPLPGHGLLDVLVNADLNGTALNVELLGWATGSLLPLALLLFVLHWRRGDRFMLGMSAAVIGVHCFYWFSGGPDFGARYWYLILLPCLALTASVVRAIDRSAASAGRATLAAIALSLSTLAAFIPWRATDKYYHYRGMRPDIREMAHAYDWRESLIFIRGNRHPDYHSAAVYNPLDLHATDPIYAWDRDSTTRAAVLRAYPGRRVWYVDGPSVTGDRYRLTKGPSPDSLPGP